MKDPYQPVPTTQSQRASYRCFAELAACERAGVNFEISMKLRDPAVIILAPHAGGIEPGTSEISEALAGEHFSLYQFISKYPDLDMRLHITSSKFDEPQALRLVGSSRYTLTVHGCLEEEECVFVGGKDIRLKFHVEQQLRAFDIPVSDTPHLLYNGLHPENICNRNKAGAGVQLELSSGIRKKLLETPELLKSFAEAIRKAIQTTRQLDWNVETLGAG